MEKKHSSTSTWRRDVSLPVFPALTKSARTDVVILGGGLTGVLSAYLLAKAGTRVVVLEKGTIGSGATARTTGFLTQSIDTNFADLIWMLGEKKARLIIESHGAGIDLIERIVKDEHIECEFMRCDDVVFAPAGKGHDAQGLDTERAAACALGLDAVIEPEKALPFPNAGSLRLKHQAKFHVLKFLAGLANAAKKAGAEIYEHTEVASLEHSDTGVVVHAGNTTVEALWALSATYEPFAEPWGEYFKKGMYVSYVMELRAPAGSLPVGTYEDTDNPYHYFRVDADGSHDRIVVGGEDHRLDIPVSKEKNFKALEEYITKTFPLLSYEVITRWAGHVLEPIDGIAFIGPYKSERTWYAFGFSGNGMTYAPIAASMFCDRVMGKKDPRRAVYDARRIPGPKSMIVKAADFAGEFIHGAIANTFAQK